MLQETANKPVGVIGNTLPFQDRSVVFPFMQQPDQRFVNQHPAVQSGQGIQGIQRQFLPINPNFNVNSQYNPLLSPR